MIKIKNPFNSRENNHFYNCFGCAPDNKSGLKLQFWLKDDVLIAKWNPEKHFEGWVGVLHGGIQATLMDEAAAWVVFVCVKTAGLTTEMKTRYLKPVYMHNGPLTIEAKLLSLNKKIARIACTLEDSNGQICAISDLTYYCLPVDIACEKYNYPGYEAFF